MIRRFSPLIKSILTSFLCFSFDYALLYALTEFCGLYYLVSAALSFAAANTLNFYLCARWVFHGGLSGGRQYAAFLAVGAVGLALNTALMALFTSALCWHYMLSKVASGCLVFFWNYLMRRHAIFKA